MARIRSSPIERDPPPGRAVADALRRLPPRALELRVRLPAAGLQHFESRPKGDPVQLGRAGNTASTLTKLRCRGQRRPGSSRGAGRRSAAACAVQRTCSSLYTRHFESHPPAGSAGTRGLRAIPCSSQKPATQHQR
eukprot:tig00000178_g12810.t1